VTKRVIEVTPEQVRLAQTKVEADVKTGRTSDPMVVLVSKARGRGHSALRGQSTQG
jgi:hypothetical protein